MRLVVNVDDMGLHPAVQRAVERTADAGIVTSASVMANGPWVRAARRLTGIGLGAHLNILRGPPLSPPREVASLVGTDGLFLGNYRQLYRKSLRGGLDLAQVELEWDRQIELLFELSLPLTHLDSEKHIHCWPQLMPIACRLAAKHRLRWVRRSVEHVAWNRWDGGAMKARLLHWWSRSHVAHPSVSWPDAVWGIADGGVRLSPERFVSAVERMPAAHVVEIVCHPGDRRPYDPPLPGNFGPMRVERLWRPEFESLLNPQWPSLARERDWQLTHYGMCESATTTADELALGNVA